MAYSSNADRVVTSGESEFRCFRLFALPCVRHSSGLIFLKCRYDPESKFGDNCLRFSTYVGNFLDMFQFGFGWTGMKKAKCMIYCGAERAHCPQFAQLI